jgi:hypothetical protein
LGNGVGFCTFIANDPTTSSIVQTLATSWKNSKSSYVFDNTPTPIKKTPICTKKTNFHYIKIPYP